MKKKITQSIIFLMNYILELKIMVRSVIRYRKFAYLKNELEAEILKRIYFCALEICKFGTVYVFD